MAIFKYKIFHTVIEKGGLTKAAEALNLTQSGVSHAISSLEAEFGFSLLTRDRAGVTLTSNGERVLACIHEILRSDEKLRQEVAAINGLETGTVKIATLASVSAHWLPGIIKEFKDQYPALEIELEEGDYDTVEQLIATGSVDFGFVSLPTVKPFEVIPLVKDNMLFILPASHRLKDQTTIKFDEIKNEPFIMPKWGYNDEVRNILNENKVKLQIKYEVTGEQTIISMVQNELGISILPEMVLRIYTHNLRTVKLDKPAFRNIGIALNSSKNASPATRKFLNCVQSWLRRQGIIPTNESTAIFLPQ